VKNKMNAVKNKLPLIAVPSVKRQASSEDSSQLLETENLKLKTHSAFTLIELLVVISIIAVLAAFSISVLGGVKKTQYISHARAEMAQLESAIESYKATYGFYPPDNGNNVLTNQLYYELIGTTNTSSGVFATLDGSQQNIDLAAFGISGFVNCSKQGAGSEDSAAAKNFIHELKPGQTKTLPVGATSVTLFVTSVRGPDADYLPVGQQDINPWRYRNPGVNNPNSYDLWVQLKISGKTNLVCNWSKQVQINNPLP